MLGMQSVQSPRSRLLSASYDLPSVLQQLHPSSLIGSVQLGEHIFSKGFDCFSCDDLLANSSLDDNFKHLSVDMFFELFDPLFAHMSDLRLMENTRDSINRFFVYQQLELDNVARPPFGFFIIESCISLGARFQFAEEVVHQLS